MKKKSATISLIAVLTALMLLTAGCTGVETVQPAPTAAAEPIATVQPSADPLAEYSVVGPWGLSTAKNDMASLYTVFGTSLRDYGASMEIKDSGEMQYSVGATGGAGTYTRNGSALTAQLKDYNEGSEQTLELQLTEDGGQVYLTCLVYETTLWWTQNEAEMEASAAPADTNAMDTSAYNALLELYRTALRDKYDDLQLSEAGLNYMFNFYREKDGLSEIGYCFTDLDGDGSPELLIAPVSNEDAFLSTVVFDMYTLVDGEPVQVFTAGERYRYYLMNDRTLYFEGSNGAAESVYVQYTIAQGDLSEMMCITLNYAAEAGSQWSATYSGGEPQPMTEEDANAMIASWQAQITKPEYTPFGA